MSKVLIKVIEIYQRYLSFDTGLLKVFAPMGACRYSISCSEYTKQQIAEKGAIKGIYLGLRRVVSCI